MQGENCNNTTYTTSWPYEFNQSILIQIQSTSGEVYLINYDQSGSNPINSNPIGVGWIHLDLIQIQCLV